MAALTKELIWDSLPRMGYRKCDKCSEMSHVRKLKRLDLCEKCFKRKREVKI